MSKGKNTQRAIVKAARRMIAQKGYQQTSIQKIADIVGISQSAVLHHFKSKADLFRGVIEYMVEENSAIADKYRDPKDDAHTRLMKYFDVNYEWGVEYDYNAQVMTCLFHFASHDPQFKDLYTEVVKGSHDKILDCLYAGEREGIFKFAESSSSAETIGEILRDAALGFMLTSVTTKIPRNHREKMRKKWRILVERLTSAT